MSDKTENMVAREVASLINRTELTGVRPMRPKKSTRDDLSEPEKLRHLADEWEIYEAQKKAYDQSRTAYNQEIKRLYAIMFKKAIEENFPDAFPDELSGEIYAKVYEDRHSEGYYAVLESLEEDAELYVKCWQFGLLDEQS